jgi:tRNA1Val (adenine37-N6)-methyltransferase
MTGTFFFKQFKVEDGLSTMKIGTDAVLLGASAGVENAEEILEIGTGCGVISLILAQRSYARIDAIDIDGDSVKQAEVNVMNSPWNDRITIIHKSLQEFTRQTKRKYDLIITNPPFFSRSLKSEQSKRNISRHNDSLSFRELIQCSSLMMTDKASLWVILPARESREFISTALTSGFFIHSMIRIIPKPGKEYHRVILQIKKTHSLQPEEKNLTIKNTDSSYSMEYKELTKELYIDF